MKSNFCKGFSVLLAVLLTVISVPVAALAATPIYTYECSATAPAKELVTHFEHNDAIDSWAIDTTKNYADGLQISLKPIFNPPRTHFTFAFSVETAGTYYLAIKYYAYPDTDGAQRRICVQIDDLGKEDISVTKSSSTDANAASGHLYLIIPMSLTAGDHTFSVYAPMEYGQTIEGSFVNSANLICYDIYSNVDAEPAPEPEPEPDEPAVPGGALVNDAYTEYEYTSQLPSENDGATKIMSAYNNDAVDSFNQTYVTGLADNTALSLKLDFASGPRTHLTFAFNTSQKGTYKIAIEYNAPQNVNLHRILLAQVDNMGKQQFSVKTNPVDGANQYLILTVSLEAGAHTLSLYASEQNGESDGSGKLYAPSLLYAYSVWQVEDVRSIYMETGAAVSMTETPFLRFTARFSKGYYDQLVSEFGEESLSLRRL